MIKNKGVFVAVIIALIVFASFGTNSSAALNAAKTVTEYRLSPDGALGVGDTVAIVTEYEGEHFALSISEFSGEVVPVSVTLSGETVLGLTNYNLWSVDEFALGDGVTLESKGAVGSYLFRQSSSLALNGDPSLDDAKICFAENMPLRNHTAARDIYLAFNGSGYTFTTNEGDAMTSHIYVAKETSVAAPTVTLKTSDGTKTVATITEGQLLPSYSGQKVFVGWSDGESLYSAGTTCPEGITSLNAVEIEFYVGTGASIRFGEDMNDSGIRFITYVNLSDISSLTVLEMGAIIAPSQVVDEIEDFSFDYLTVGTNALKIEAEIYDDYDGYRVFKSAIVKVKTENYALNLSCRGYLKVSYADHEGYVYSEFSKENNTRSIYYVACRIREDNYRGLTEARRQLVDGFISVAEKL